MQEYRPRTRAQQLAIDLQYCRDHQESGRHFHSGIRYYGTYRVSKATLALETKSLTLHHLSLFRATSRSAKWLHVKMIVERCWSCYRCVVELLTWSDAFLIVLIDLLRNANTNRNGTSHFWRNVTSNKQHLRTKLSDLCAAYPFHGFSQFRE